MKRSHRKFRRSKKGMSTIFGALFFVILILMGFNMFLWDFVQFDNYNRIIANMTQTDTMSLSENLVPNNPGARDFTANSFNITVNNLGIAVRVARIYIVNLSPTNSNQCLPANPCIVDQGSSSPGIANGNVQEGVIDYRIKVNTGGTLSPINDGNGYKVILSTTRGRQFSFFYPWPVTPSSGGNPGGTFQTNIGPLSIFFDFKSFNFTQGSQTQSQPAWCVPSGPAILLYLKLVNQATDSDVMLEPNTMIQSQPYSANGFGQFVRTWIVDPGSVNPNNMAGYNFNTNPYDLPAAGPSGPGAPVIVKFGGIGQGGTGGASFARNDNWLTFIGFYYLYQGRPQGQTIPFMDFKDTSGYPGTC